MPHRRWIIIACLFLVAAMLATYGDMGNHQFINYDDPLYVTDTPPVQDGLTLKGLSEGKLDQAMDHYDEALRLKPDYADASINLGDALAKQGKIDEAIIIFQDCLKINPDNTIAQKLLSKLRAPRPHN